MKFKSYFLYIVCCFALFALNIPECSAAPGYKNARSVKKKSFIQKKAQRQKGKTFSNSKAYSKNPTGYGGPVIKKSKPKKLNY